MEPIIIILQIPILLGATAAVTFGSRLAFACGKRFGHVLGVSGVAMFWAAAFTPSVLHQHTAPYVAWEASHVYHVSGCPYGPNVLELDAPRPGMRPCDYCAAKTRIITAAEPHRNPISNETMTVSAAVSESFGSILSPPRVNIGASGRKREGK